MKLRQRTLFHRQKSSAYQKKMVNSHTVFFCPIRLSELKPSRLRYLQGYQGQASSRNRQKR